MTQPIRPNQKDSRSRTTPSAASKEHVDAWSKDKKILPGRRHQRHSTEIGCEYHRWWVVRNVLGFETNEHIAGLLLDSFHSALENLVLSCGGLAFDPQVHGLEVINDHQQSKSPNSGTAASEKTGSSAFSQTPPGPIEDMNEFVHFKSTIDYYCESLFQMCGQQERMQHVMPRLSQPVQQFLIKLIGYLHTSRAKSQMVPQRRRRSRPTSKKPCSPDSTKVPDVEVGLFKGRSIADCTEYDPSQGNLLPSWHSQSANLGERNEQNPHATVGSAVFSHTEKRRGQAVDEFSGNQLQYVTCSNPSADGKHYIELTDGSVSNHDDRYNDKPHHVSSKQHKDRPASAKQNTEKNLYSADGDSLHQSDRYGKVSSLGSGNCHNDQQSNSGQNQQSNSGQNQQSNSGQSYQDYESQLTAINYELGKESNTSPSQQMSNARLLLSPALNQPPTEPGTPSVYLDCDEGSSHTMQDDECLKSLLNRPVKVQSVSTPQFYSNDGSKWPSSPSPNQDQETLSEVNRTNSTGKFVILSQPKSFGQKDPQTSATDLSVKPGHQIYCGDVSKFNLGATQTSKNLNLPYFPGQNAMPPLVYSSTNATTRSDQQRPLGTPVLLYPPGGFPCTDNSLASLPTLVQNIVYNSSGAPLISPLPDSINSSSSLMFQPSVSTSTSPLSTAGTANTTCVASVPNIQHALPAYTTNQIPSSSVVPFVYNMSSHSGFNSLYSLPKVSNSTVTSFQQLGMSASSTSSIKNTSSALLQEGYPPHPGTTSSTKLYRQLVVGPHNLVSSSPTEQHLMTDSESHSPQTTNNNHIPFKITDVRSYSGGNFASSSNSWTVNNDKPVSMNNEIASRERTLSTIEVPTKPAASSTFIFTECHGLSGRKLNVVSDMTKQTGASNKPFTDIADISGIRTTNLSSKSSYHSQRDSSTFGSRTEMGEQPSKYTSNKPQKISNGKKSNYVSHSNDSSRYTSSLLKPNQAKNSLQQGYFAGAIHGQAIKDVTVSQAEPITVLVPEPENHGISGTGQKLVSTEKPVTTSSRSTSSARRQFCIACQLVFSSATDLLLHRYELHSLVCGECDSRFLSTSALTKHKESDHPRIARCQHCRFATFDYAELKHHVMSEHNENGVNADMKIKDNRVPQNESNSDTNGSNKRTTCHSSEQKGTANMSAVAESSLNRSVEKEPYRTQQEKVHTGKNVESCNAPDFSTFSAYGVTREEYSHDAYGSEIDDPPLVIDTSEFTGTDNDNIGCSNQGRPVDMLKQVSQKAAENWNEQPLCLVVHRRDSIDSPMRQDVLDSAPQKSSIQSIERKDRTFPVVRVGGYTGGDSVSYPNLFTVNTSLKHSTNTVTSVPRKRKRKRTNKKSLLLNNDVSPSSITERNSNVNNDVCPYSQTINRVASLKMSQSVSGAWTIASENEKQGEYHQMGYSVSNYSRNESKSLDVNTGTVSSSTETKDGKFIPKLKAAIGKHGHRLAASQSAIALRDRHTMSSLPPKKRSIRKSSRQSTSSNNTESDTNAACSIDSSIHDVQMKQKKFDLGRVHSQKIEPNSIQMANERSQDSVNHFGTQPPKSNLTCSAEAVTSVIPIHITTGPKRGRPLNSSKKPRRDTKRRESLRKHQTGPPNKIKRKLRNHDRHHDVQPVELSGKPYSSTSTSLESIQSLNKNKNKFSCSMASCQQAFASRRELRHHIAEAHQGKVRRHLCSWQGCGKGFFARTHLRTHMLVHTEEKPISCSQCTYRCRQRTALAWHMRKHEMGIIPAAQQEQIQNPKELENVEEKM